MMSPKLCLARAGGFGSGSMVSGFYQALLRSIKASLLKIHDDNNANRGQPLIRNAQLRCHRMRP